MFKRSFPAFIIVATLVVVGASVGVVTAHQAITTLRNTYHGTSTVHKIMHLVEKSWVDDIDEATLVDGAIDGMMARLDPHSMWLPPKLWQQLETATHGTYEGIGVRIRMTDKGPMVVKVLPGSPANQSGIKPGDLITGIDGQAVQSNSLNAIGNALVGEIGTSTELSLLRPGHDKPITVQTVRATVHEPSVSSTKITEDVGYIRLQHFRDGSTEEVMAALQDLGGDKLRGLVLDLRDNAGGLLLQAVQVADLFVDGGPIVSTRGRIKARDKVYNAHMGAWPGEMVILVNGLSASGAEIVAAALQDTARARLVGTPTYGKGTVQTVYEYRDGSAIKLTVGRYYTPSGAPVASRDGRVPDVLVPWPQDEDPRTTLSRTIAAAKDLDAQTRKELLALIDKLPDAVVRHTSTDVQWNAPMDERLAKDPQLARAVSLIQTSLATP